MTRRRRVLGLSLARELLDPSMTHHDESRRRLGRYAEGLDALVLLVHAPARTGLRESTLAAGFRVIPTRSLGPATSAAAMVRRGLQLARGARFDLVTAQEPLLTGIAGLVLSKRLGLPLLVHVYGPNPWDKGWLGERSSHRVLAPVARAVLRAASAIQVDATGDRETLLHAGIADDRIHVTPLPPADLHAVGSADGTSVRASFAADGFDRIVLCVARLTAQKNLHGYLDAARMVLQKRPATAFPIVGDGPLLGKLRAQARRLGVDRAVRFVEHCPRHQTLAHFAACDVFALASRYDGYARAMMEASAAGRPIVVTDVAGARDAVVDGETGHVVPLGDMSALGARILELLRDPDRGVLMGAAGRARALALLDPGAQARRQIEIYEHVASLGQLAAAPPAV